MTFFVLTIIDRQCDPLGRATWSCPLGVAAAQAMASYLYVFIA
jgi:hypothetical protein